MDYLEQRRVIHRDLAARNILVAGSQTVKITDFGLAQTPNRGNYYIRQTNRALPLRWSVPLYLFILSYIVTVVVSLIIIIYTVVSKWCHMVPLCNNFSCYFLSRYALECIEHGKFSHKSDVWSYGVTCWEMFTRGEEPHLPQKPDLLIQVQYSILKFLCGWVQEIKEIKKLFIFLRLEHFNTQILCETCTACM